ncbi:hypothetical protein P4S72_19455 [Vibrio sp. PP-XX7]
MRNQRHDEIPLLFAYSQMLLAINGNEGRYGTCGILLNFGRSGEKRTFQTLKCIPSRIKNYLKRKLRACF